MASKRKVKIIKHDEYITIKWGKGPDNRTGIWAEDNIWDDLAAIELLLDGLGIEYEEKDADDY